MHFSTGLPSGKICYALTGFLLYSKSHQVRERLTVLSWGERVELAHCFAPRLILFPEKKELGKPRIEGGAGDYHPRSLDLLLERGRLFPGTLRSLARGQIEWLLNQNSRPRATLDNLAKSDNTSHQIRLLGPPIPNALRAWEIYFAILDQRDATGRT